MTDIEHLTDRVLEATAGEDAIDPAKLIFLLRRYGASRRDEIGDALARTLTWTIVNQPWAQARDDDRAAWLTLLAEAVAVSDDERFRDAAVDLASAVRLQAATAASLSDAARSTEACLHATDVFNLADLLQPTIDRLEQIVGGAYEPGEGMGRGDLDDQVYPASALLAAYRVTGRLPYSMLAEELMQFALRTLWDAGEGGFFAHVGDRRAKSFAPNCDAARVLCRLASLHLDADYHRAAVTARDADYARDAERTLASQAASLDAGGDAARYGLALSEWLNLK